jgi:hypothetical protein
MRCQVNRQKFFSVFRITEGGLATVGALRGGQSEPSSRAVGLTFLYTVAFDLQEEAIHVRHDGLKSGGV